MRKTLQNSNNIEKKQYPLKEVVFNTVVKARGKETRIALPYRECLACLTEINGFDKEKNKLTCSTICGLGLQRKIYEAESDEEARTLFKELGFNFDRDQNSLDEYFGLEFHDPLGKFSTAGLGQEGQQETNRNNK